MDSQKTSADARAKQVWSLGSYAAIAPDFLSMAADLVETAAVSSEDTVLDVACGTGNVAITAARRGALVTGLDLVAGMLEQAQENASIAGVEVDWREGSATALPFADDSFDVTLSCVGHMFATPPEEAGAELLRVTKPGGRIGFTCWTPESVVPAMGAVLVEYLPPDPDAPDPPFLWGDPDVVRERLGTGVEGVSFETGTVMTPAISPAHYWEAATTESGLFIAALDAVAEDDLPALRAELIETIERYFDEGQNGVPMTYRLTTATVV